jgi:hypothetical protein
MLCEKAMEGCRLGGLSARSEWLVSCLNGLIVGRTVVYEGRLWIALDMCFRPESGGLVWA